MAEITKKNGTIPVRVITNKVNLNNPIQMKHISNNPTNTFTYKNTEYVCWGDNNRFPDDAVQLIHRTGVLQTAIEYKARCGVANGIIPVLLEGLDENLKEIYKPLNDIDLLLFLKNDTFKNYFESCFRDLNKFGNCFCVLFPDKEGNKIIRIDALNARHCRISKDKKKLLVYGDFRNNTIPSKDDKNLLIYDMLDEIDPQTHLQSLKENGKFKHPIAYPRIKNFLSNDDYYARTDWWAAYKSGWIGIAQKIPKFLEKAYENAITAMWHVKVPDSYYNTYFPANSYTTNELRLAAIKQWQDELEKNLTGVENANKAMFSTFSLN
jgi:hypothetical protein